jgi:hypothetical protein
VRLDRRVVRGLKSIEVDPNNPRPPAPDPNGPWMIGSTGEVSTLASTASSNQSSEPWSSRPFTRNQIPNAPADDAETGAHEVVEDVRGVPAVAVPVGRLVIADEEEASARGDVREDRRLLGRREGVLRLDEDEEVVVGEILGCSRVAEGGSRIRAGATPPCGRPSRARPPKPRSLTVQYVSGVAAVIPEAAGVGKRAGLDSDVEPLQG